MSLDPLVLSRCLALLAFRHVFDAPSLAFEIRLVSLLACRAARLMP